MVPFSRHSVRVNILGVWHLSLLLPLCHSGHRVLIDWNFNPWSLKHGYPHFYTSLLLQSVKFVAFLFFFFNFCSHSVWMSWGSFLGVGGVLDRDWTQGLALCMAGNRSIAELYLQVSWIPEDRVEREPVESVPEAKKLGGTRILITEHLHIFRLDGHCPTLGALCHSRVCPCP